MSLKWGEGLDKLKQKMQEPSKPDIAETIALLNDTLRSTGVGGKLVVTKGVAALRELSAVYQQVKTFNTFDKDNDPYGERDFGRFTFRGVEIFWKIDYFDSDLISESPNPADPTVTTRLLTILLASEY